MNSNQQKMQSLASSNDLPDVFICALVSIQNTAMFTLPIGISALSEKKFHSGYPPVFAAVVVTALPVYAAVIAAQGVFIRSLAIGGRVKG